ncbi:MAG: carboxypeptidase-like regulatory domain-containing protein [bacterium]|nr:carboxypeptidase-like regulatory domain-containing protein [bacterium]MDT8395006.1 carboxypeptidase-like regulatory domain-containing protein [bacterium]
MIRWTFKDPGVRAGTRVLIFAIAAALLVPGCGSHQPSRPATVTGTVTVSLADALVYIYQEGDDIFGPARVISEPTATDGSFSLSLKPGKYLAVARKRVSGESAGPVLIGDYRSEPVAFEVSQGQEKVVLSMTAVIKVSNEKAFPASAQENATGIAGRVSDADGNPVEGTRVHVYDHIQMSERPKYVSERTGADGKYFVPVKRGGTYYLSARDRFGGPPQIGDLFGRYDEGTVDPSGVVVRKGEVTGDVDITVHKVW